eukprot:gene7765-8611_t
MKFSKVLNTGLPYSWLAADKACAVSITRPSQSEKASEQNEHISQREQHNSSLAMSSATTNSTTNRKRYHHSSSCPVAAKRKENRQNYVENKRRRLTNAATANCSNVPKLTDICAKHVAENFAYQQVEDSLQHIPEPIQERIVFWAFPREEQDIALYSSTNSHFASNNQQKQPFQLGIRLFESGNVSNVLQVDIQGSPISVPLFKMTHAQCKRIYFVCHATIARYSHSCLDGSLRLKIGTINSEVAAAKLNSKKCLPRFSVVSPKHD